MDLMLLSDIVKAHTLQLSVIKTRNVTAIRESEGKDGGDAAT